MSKLQRFQTAIGAATFFSVMFFGLKAILPDSSPITVHSLTYDPATGLVTVDRTIDTDQPYFVMSKTAQVIDQDTLDPLEGCEGIKFVNFMAGHRRDAVPLAQWSGNPACTPESLSPGTYRLAAVYIWGDHQLAAVGEPFTIPEKKSP